MHFSQSTRRIYLNFTEKFLGAVVLSFRWTFAFNFWDPTRLAKKLLQKVRVT